MTVTVILPSTGETFEVRASNLQELKNEIYEKKGIPQAYQVCDLPHELNEKSKIWFWNRC